MLEPGVDLTWVGMFGGFRALGTLIVAAAGFDPAILRDAVAPFDKGGCDTQFGASSLPNGAGAGLKVLAATTRDAATIVACAASEARRVLLGSPAPPSRRP